MTRFRAVPAAGYATAVCVLWVLTFIVGSYIYTKYRIYIRIPIEQAGSGGRKASSISRSMSRQSV